MKKVITALGVVVASATTASATAGFTTTSVPEISALEGTAAIAALAAIVLLAWERRRRSA